MNFYTRWLDETKERIKTRDDIINNPNEFDGVKTIAIEQKADMTKTKEYLETKVKESPGKGQYPAKEIDDKNKLIENYEKTRSKPVDYAAEAKKRLILVTADQDHVLNGPELKRALPSYV